MVKIVDGKREELEKEERLERLVDIAGEAFGKEQILGPGTPSETLFCVFRRLNIYSDINEIDVSNKEDYDSARKLAEKYEEIDKKEWTLKTLY